MSQPKPITHRDGKPCTCYHLNIIGAAHSGSCIRFREPERDDERMTLSLTLTRRQWRAIKDSLGDTDLAAHSVLWDELDTWDLDEEPA